MFREVSSIDHFTRDEALLRCDVRGRAWNDSRIVSEPKDRKRESLICLVWRHDVAHFHAICIKVLFPIYTSLVITQCFPIFTYSKDGKHKQDNITPKARTLFQIFYDDDGITAADIFHYVYAVLHHPAYRTRFAENLKRDLPRIPFVGVGGLRPPNSGKKDGGRTAATQILSARRRRDDAGQQQARPQSQSQRQVVSRIRRGRQRNSPTCTSIMNPPRNSNCSALKTRRSNWTGALRR